MSPMRPSSLSRDAFRQAFGTLYEHSPWVAEAVYDAGERGQWDDWHSLGQCFAKALRNASRERQLALIQAHPDLAGKAALRGELTANSRCEQAAAGLDACSAAQLARFHELNESYRQRFGFPFILAVKGLHTEDILSAFAERLGHSPEQEFTAALEQINRIALLRLGAVFEQAPSATGKNP